MREIENTETESEAGMELQKEEFQWKFRFKHVFLVIVSMLLLLSIFSHNSSDLAVIEGGSNAHIRNWIGTAGAHFARLSLYLFGVATYPMLFLFFLCAFRPVLPYPTRRHGYTGALFAVVMGITILFAMWPEKFVDITDYLGIGALHAPFSALSGGTIGQKLAAPELSVAPGIITEYLGTAGCLIIALVLVISGSAFIWYSDWQPVLNTVRDRKEKNKKIEESVETLSRKGRKKISETYEDDKKEYGTDGLLPIVDKNTDAVNNGIGEASKKKAMKVTRTQYQASRYALPPVTLLEKGKDVEGEEQQYIEASKNVIQSTLDSFGIQGKVISYISGPRVTRYEISLDPGVKVERISSLERNFAMELQAKSVRILAPIPGRNTVGIEVPNSTVSLISIRSIMESSAWSSSETEIPIILGRDVAGHPVVTDLAMAPHLLIAGTTGSGKSVCMHSIMMSLLFRFTPSELKLILVDPKLVEFAMYTPLPHLIVPVVSKPEKVPLALHWGVNEMERRYRIFSKAKAKKLSDFNRREKPAVPVLDDDGNEIPDKMPILVIIIDELADIMMTDAKASVENSIARIAQKGRAAGIHMVIATQTPRKAIITGVIKANLPTRVAFLVSGIVDSGVILDRKGAEKLLGKGDMLFIPPGSPNPERIQGSMVSEKEIEKIVNFVSGQEEQRFDETVFSGNAAELEAELPSVRAAEADEDDFAGVSEEDLVKLAIEAILTDGKASTSYIQRRLNIGYNKAANIIEILEKKGVVGPPVGANAKREILISRDEYR